MMGLLARTRPDLRPRRDNVPQRQEPEPKQDIRPEWLRRGDDGRNKAKELAR